ncbi:hypothetical protein JOF29_002871 [Kribbella aluminosa]|uniref:DUF3892 domain-containing protein n=1 Tax=Kribbella aluminosa TaxID=416017 RepID=A0ABS4UJH1_9ACTN|nr:hypothetical protein [Kribbella aluminosa]
MSLATQFILDITAVRMQHGRDDLRGVEAVRWESISAVREECSVGDLIWWMTRGGGRAYVRLPDGVRGPRIEVVDGRRFHLRSGPADDGYDCLLRLPRI